MDFTPSDEQSIIRDSARRLFERECSVELLHAAWADPAASLPLWRDHLVDWLSLADQPLAHTVFFLEEYGRVAVPGPFFSALLAALLRRIGNMDEHTPAAIALGDAAGEWVSGDQAYAYVAGLEQLERVLLVGGSASAPRVAVVACADCSITPVEHLDQLRPQYRLALQNNAEWSDLPPADWEKAYRAMLVCAAAELTGVARYLLEAALQYAGAREQFGQPIGSFQGLQWQLVDAASGLERAAAAVGYAAMCADAVDADAQRAAHIAKLEAGAAARHCARVSLQVHGGIGYTWEHGLHYWLRRAYAGDAFLGNTDFHARRLGELLFAA